LALQRSDMMLRDQHYRINMTSPNIASFRRISSELISVIITSFKAISLRHSKSFFMTAVTPMPSSGCDL
jgi:hypothetical protein